MSGPIELVLARAEGKSSLVSPEVGLFTDPLPRGAAVVAGQRAGFLLSLGRAFELRVPAGAAGTIASAPAERVRSPVGFGDAIYELEAGAPRPEATTESAPARETALVLRSPQAGRFYHRASPAEAPFVTVGAVIEEGRSIGLIEVMKTFGHVPYRSGGRLPGRARVVRFLAGDGADVKPGDGLIEVEPA
jgi:acetyl-CoA carboxylase biotin carboxyl carrier protein